MNIRLLIAAVAILLSGQIQAQENIALHKPVHEGGAIFGSGYDAPGVGPEHVTDGVFLAEGDPFYLGSWWLDTECEFTPEGDPPPLPEPCNLLIDLQGFYEIYSFVFQGDVDGYLLQYWDEGSSTWMDAWMIDEISGVTGMQTRFSPEEMDPIITPRLRIIGMGGDGQYGVGELQAFGVFIDPCRLGGGQPAGGGCWSGDPRFETHVVAGELCYRFELSCEGLVHGGYGSCVFPDGFFDFGMGGSAGDPPEPGDPPPPPDNPSCGFGGGHLLNDKVEHVCSLMGAGKVKLEVKAVNMRRCRRTK